MIFSGKLFAIIGTVLAVTAGGSPVEITDRELEPRSLGNVYFCTDNGFQGTCNLFGVENDVCNNVPDGFNDDISAFGPDRGIGCELFENSYCGGNSIFLAYPGNAYLANLGFGDTTSSFRCINFS